VGVAWTRLRQIPERIRAEEPKVAEGAVRLESLRAAGF
jgi:hypothetical protein